MEGMEIAMKLIRGLIRIAFAIIVMIVLGNGVLPQPVCAQSLAISGSFYRHHFQMLPGESFSTPDVYIVVFNHDEKDMTVRLTTTSPPGVEIHLDETQFTLPARSNRSLAVGVSVSEETTPGDYTISISVDILPDEIGGIAIIGAAEQRAKLTVFGEAGRVHISVVTPDGKPFQSKVHVYQKLEGALSPAGYSETGQFSSRLVPGEYMVQAFFGEYEVAKEEFALAAGEEKHITLVARTVFILGFSPAPSYDEATGRISAVRTVYTIRNIYQPLQDVRTMLRVELEGSPLESVEIMSLPTLDIGNTSGTYTYVPSVGWQTGIYSFRIELLSQDTLYAVSPMEEIAVKAGMAGTTRWVLIAALGAVLLAAGIIMWRRRRR